MILCEANGDYPDNSDSLAKCRLGNQWQELAGPDYSYFMEFESKPITNAYTITKVKEMIGMLWPGSAAT